MDKMLYLCDRRRCDRCSYPVCQHTTDITHAKHYMLGVDNMHFVLGIDNKTLVEVEDNEE